MPNNTAVIYHYFERDKTYRDNFIYFLANGVHEEADFFIIISEGCSFSPPRHNNVTYIEADNWNNDYGGYSKYVKEYFCGSYEYYVFINSSVRGPFTPAYYENCWNNIFTSRLKDGVNLIGTSITIPPRESYIAAEYEKKFSSEKSYSHVQSTSYALTRDAVMHLIDIGFYDVEDNMDKLQVILAYEVRLSREIIKRGWSIASLLPVYEGADYLNESTLWENISAQEGDALWALAFFGRSASPLEAVFIKTNRDMINETDLASFTFTSLHSNISSLNSFKEAHLLLEESYQALSETARQRRVRTSKVGNIQRLKKIIKRFF